MNILPKKSWHVRTKKNIERIHRDEEEAERRQKLEEDRVLRVEQEARLRELRTRAELPEPEPKHFNLFEDFLERQKSSNREHEEERERDEITKQERLGISNRLGRSEDANKPWYCRADRPKANLKSNSHRSERGLICTSSGGSAEASKSNTLITSIYDPMTAIKEAEQIVKIKRQRDLQWASTSSGGSQRVSTTKVDPKARSERDDSSPEVVKIIKAKDSSRRKHKKSKKSHKHKKRSSDKGRER